MRRISLRVLALAAVLAAGIGGYWAGVRGLPVAGLREWLGREGTPVTAQPEATGAIIYYQDPDGRPAYSTTPRQTRDGRAFRAVRASEDVSFEERPPATADATPRRILYYRNPMGLPDTSPTPKKDSMGMDYIPVYEGEDDGSPVVRVPLGKLQRTGVRSELATRRPVGRSMRVPGMVQLDERRISVVATRSDAFINEVASVTTGDRVKKGQVLLRLYSPDIAAAGAQFLSDLNIGGRDSAAGGARQRLENLGVPPEAIAEIERTRKVPLSMTWRAPRDGVVLERNVVDGMKAAPGDVLFRLADISTIWVLADVPEFDLEAVRLGAPVAIHVRSLPGRTFEGRASLIYPQVGEATRATRVRIEIANPGDVLLPNMYAEVEIGAGDAAPVLAVPESAVIDSGTRQFVIIDRGEGQFEPRNVKIGARGAGFTEIREGIAEGDRVVVAANFLIDAESNLKAALRGLTPPEPQP
ncbi:MULTISPECIES: efflux RND transporter periplasmic adaptor subunit [Hyphomicrobiales]|uniref:efflux RND transporter periplasmic adaptor subunit n=1 Tax=Hyphomicrobiales TaxID=356 RepID=UPI001BCEF59F|nr:MULTISPECIES: efflux RND transporter periplasmic adaptor subunit [Hyphomicrobiales]MBS7743619.1 efflux RND transporter periplasmic adaptor subunit [Chelatococcus sp. HY11]MCP9629997.1 efflux RND transporter periplasmic adaptor subunit [Rhodopseudomonas palustris]CAH1662773.1 Cation transporter [Hyphomicrobiales bacterium]MBX3546478.1 efflux RND transporter periplasmic adaptor subunit [Chelatococcus sp.]MCO5079684.1 efflux RND transporter periplasmic adaptor subunit [Chelatococcus sp.]